MIRIGHLGFGGIEVSSNVLVLKDRIRGESIFFVRKEN